jgi:hypothetical protein
MKTMEKLYDHLHEIIENNKDSLKSVKDISKDFINDKYNKYFKDKETKQAIDEVIYESYDNNIENAKNMCMNVKKMNNMNIKKVQNCKKYKKDRNEIIDKKTRIDKLIHSYDEDMYYLYDSDGNTKA